MISKDILLGPRLKAERANRHINELANLTQPLSSQFYRLEVQSRLIPPYVDKYRYELSFVSKEPIPERLATIIGDAIHNLRAGLDHLTSGIVRTVDAKARPYFPVTSNRKDLESSGALKLMEAALPGSQTLILDKIRPTDDPRENLWRFGSLDIDDKHNLLVPTVVVSMISGINAKSGGTVIQNHTSRFNVTKPPKAIIASALPLTVEGEPHTTVEVKFGEGTPFKDNPVVPTLLDISKMVNETIEAFASLIER
jgi:hypothetical protein